MITQTIKKCAVCQREYPLAAGFCPIDGNCLVEIPTGDPEPAHTAPYGGVPAEPPSDPVVGRVLERRYRIVEPIGHGGMGTVYRAVHTELNRSFAVKLLRRELGTDEITIRRFRREALVLGAISHPHAVNVTDFGITDDGLAFLVMEYLEGVNLRHVVSADAPLALPRARAIFSQVCAAVSAAHRVGVVHRDLKPENIMLVETESGESAKVLDFGIARLKSVEVLTGRLTSPYIIIGTPRYMSPEACQALEQTPESDVYALGVILFEMITGHAPFECDASRPPVELAMRHMSEPPPAASSLNPELTPAIDAVLLHALAKNPEDRPSTATELAREFDAAVSSLLDAASATDPLAEARRTEPVPAADRAEPVAPPEPGAPRRALLAVLAVSLVALLLLAAATAVAALVAWRLGWLAKARPEPPTPPPTAEPHIAGPPPGMVLVPAGDVVIGELESAAPPDPADTSAPGDPPEWPPHPVHVGAFYLDTHEVTNGEYEQFLKATKAPRPATWDRGSRPGNWRDLPVAGVTWVDAENYARWAGKRLPTEEEWEYAARGSDGRIYPWGNAWDRSRAVADGRATDWPEPAGSRPSGESPFGARDMAGSVWEWTSSNYAPYPGGPPASRKLMDSKVIRGGSFASNAWAQRATNRAVQNPYSRDMRVGFRCAKSIEQ